MLTGPRAASTLAFPLTKGGNSASVDMYKSVIPLVLVCLCHFSLVYLSIVYMWFCLSVWLILAVGPFHVLALECLCYISHVLYVILLSVSIFPFFVSNLPVLVIRLLSLIKIFLW